MQPVVTLCPTCGQYHLDAAHTDLSRRDVPTRAERIALMQSLPFDPDTGDILIARVNHPRWTNVDGEPQQVVLTNVHWTVIHHSPDGYEFSYNGSGPADLALNILNLWVPPGVDGLEPVQCYRNYASRTAWLLHHRFKERFIATLPSEGGIIPGSAIRAFLDEHHSQIAAQSEAEHNDL